MASFSSIRSLVESVASGMNPISGSNRSEGDIRRIVRDHLDKAAEDIGIRIIGFELHGSRLRGDGRPDSDLDVVFEYDDGDDCGDVETREDFVFNEMSRFPLTIDGIEVDFNPINASETGTLEDYMVKDREYDKAKSTDAEYLAAVKRGDMKECSRLVREAAAKAMPNTKVVGKDGLPLVVYHASSSSEWWKRGGSFDRERIGTANGNFGVYGSGFYFTPFKDEAETYSMVQFKRDDGTWGRRSDGGGIGTFFLNVMNPIKLDLEDTIGDYEFDYESRESAENMTAGLIDSGYDGVIGQSSQTEMEDGEIVAFSPCQIKLADPVTYDDAKNVIPLSKRFDMSNPDIRW